MIESSEVEGIEVYQKDDVDAVLQSYEQLTKLLNEILHPNGDGPTSPSLCDLVGCVQDYLKNLHEKVKILEYLLAQHHEDELPNRDGTQRYQRRDSYIHGMFELSLFDLYKINQKEKQCPSQILKNWPIWWPKR